jgi:hypothetical protein
LGRTQASSFSLVSLTAESGVLLDIVRCVFAEIGLFLWECVWRCAWLLVVNSDTCALDLMRMRVWRANAFPRARACTGAGSPPAPRTSLSHAILTKLTKL